LAAPAADADLDEQWRQVELSPAEVVFVAGGDGTLLDAARRLLGSERMLAPLPGGTMNRLCTLLGLPGDLVSAVAAYAPNGPVVRIDVATVNGEIFLYESVVGLPARLVRFRERARGRGLRGWLGLLQVTLRLLRRPRRRSILVSDPPSRRRHGQAAVVRAPAPGSGAGLLLNLARPADWRTRLRQGLRWFIGRLAVDPATWTAERDRFLVHGRSPWLRLSLDGETRLLRPPLRFRVRRQALRVLTVPEV
jgi:diacylglycerol kinase family enzyme